MFGRSQQETLIFIGIAIAVAYLYYEYYYKSSKSKSTPPTTASGVPTMRKTSDCSNGMRSILKEYDLMAQLDAHATQADYDNNTQIASRRTMAGSLGKNNEQVFAKALRDKYKVSEDLEYHDKYRQYYGCGQERLAPASAFDAGAMTFAELKGLVAK